MRTPRRNILLPAALAVFVCAAALPAWAKVVERIVAVVNQEIVLLSELNERVRPMRRATVRPAPASRLTSLRPS